MTRFSTLLLILGLLQSSLLAQPNVPQRPLLQIVFPTDGDTVSFARIRIAGSTLPGAKVTVNNLATLVYSSGAFIDRVELKPGMNEITITAADSLNSTTTVIHIFRQPPIPASPAMPTEIDNRIMWPEADQTLLPGDILDVRFKGSPGGQAKFSIRKLCKHIPMIELRPEEASGMRGIYSGVVTIAAEKDIPPTPVQFELLGHDGRTVKAKSKGLIAVRRDLIPLSGETITATSLRTAPAASAIISSLPAGVRLHLLGQRDGYFKVQLASNSYGYVPAADIKQLPPGTPVPNTSISLPTYAIKGDWLQLRMNVQTHCPFTLVQTIDPAMLELTVFGAHLFSQWTTYPDNEPTIKRIRWAQPSADVFKLFVELNQPQQWGHRVRFEPGQMILEIRRTPKIAAPPLSPVAGLIFALDAGHGGTEKGAVGATGLLEKEVNLRYTQKLAARLDSAGARVILTRQTDTTMTLASRMDIARNANAHIFCWLHNNAVGATADAAAVQGTSTYFTVPQNQALAWALYPHLLNLGLKSFGRVQSDYYITRQTDMLIVLVEGAFMSHPLDEMLLADEHFLDRLAEAVFRGLEDFCRKQMPASTGQ
ncbi:MAG: N-acetylmuramoyl-L-alanine amidase [candidate division KSB1 bacterium]|nr:N-acetylmuramoyl-L-alanine amidase [candidate division KSB1 bacterium]